LSRKLKQILFRYLDKLSYISKTHLCIH